MGRQAGPVAPEHNSAEEAHKRAQAAEQVLLPGASPGAQASYVAQVSRRLPSPR
jgi:hypothetical protein